MPVGLNISGNDRPDTEQPKGIDDQRYLDREIEHVLGYQQQSTVCTFLLGPDSTE